MAGASAGPTTIDNRDQLIYALTEVAEIEHLLLCQYLYAAVSLKSHAREFANPDRRYHQVELSRKWKAKIINIAREEMQHLSYVNNILISVGGATYFARSNFPCAKRFYKGAPDQPGLEMRLEPFTEDAVERFIRFETSHIDRFKDLRTWAAIPDPNYYETLHDLYTAISDGITREMLIDVNGQYEPTDEGGEPTRLGPPRPRIASRVKTVQEARALLKEVMVEGEGALEGEADENAHVNIFRRILDDFRNEKTFDGDFTPARKVCSNPLVRWHDDIPPPSPHSSAITLVKKDVDDGLQYGLLQLFAGGYELLLMWLQQLFSHSGSAEERRAIETLVFLPYMSEVIRPLAEVLTRVPISHGKDEMLGPSFEITSNDFLVPSQSCSNQITTEQFADIKKKADELIQELQKPDYDAASKVLGTLRLDCRSVTQDLAANRLKEMESDAKHLVTLLRKYKLEDPADRLEELSVTFRLMREEFVSRCANGWPPDFGWPQRVGGYPVDEEFSEAAPPILWTRPPKKDPNEWPTDWVPPAVVELEFQGWFQCRLATDPDGAFERRGITGNGFAVGDEPDLDRIIRLQADEAVTRSHCPPVGVKVVAARLLQSALHAPSSGKPLPQLVDAKLRLLGKPKFEGRNHLVAEDGEPIDPFELEISTKHGIRLCRAVIGKPINEMTPSQRRGSGRYPISGATVSINSLRANLLRMTGVPSPQDLVHDRLENLQHDLKAIPAAESDGAKAAALKFRIEVLKKIKWNIPNVRWTRFFFNCEYFHTLSGDAIQAELGPLAGAFQLKLPSSEKYPSDSQWLINYFLGCFDTDAMAAYMYGALRIPVNLPDGGAKH